VLSLQGDFERHQATLSALGVQPVRVTMPADLDDLDAIVLPGGESTTMVRLLDLTGLRAPLEAFVRERPALGTCAGLILLGVGSSALPSPSFGVIDVTVERNAYGRQIDSFSAEIVAPVLDSPFHGVFIRAPRIRRVGSGVEIVARRVADPRRPDPDPAGEPVGVRQGRIVGLCFHPELTADLRFHRWFLGEVAGLALPHDVVAEAARAEGGAGAALSRKGRP
jgi:5'-phosphate synthase pdxT subunit